MFNKLISNLSFNPGLINQVSFYAKRLHKETSVRRLGVVLVILVMAVQMFAVMAPPQYSLAASNNDIIRGGVHSLDALKQAYKTNAQGDIQPIFEHFGVSTAQLNQARDSSVDSRGANAGRYYSLGRTLAGRHDSVEINIPGSKTKTYFRTLGGWAQKVWDAYEVPSTKYGRIWILKDCGNIVMEGLPPSGPPKLAIKKTAQPGHNSVVKPGSRIHYTLIFSNKGSGPATNLKIEDTVPAQVSNIQIGDSGAYEYVNGRTFTAYWAPRGQPSILGNNPALDYQVNFWVTVRKDAKPGRFCNNARILADGQSASSNTVCHEIPVCPYQPGITPDNPACKPPQPKTAVCTALSAQLISRTKVEFEAIAHTTGGATINSFQFDSGSGQQQTFNMNNASGKVTRNFTFTYPETPAPKSYTARLTAVSSQGNKTSNNCTQTIEIEAPKQPIVTVEKTVSSGSDSGTSTIKASPGQQFNFVFTVKNIGDGAAKDYVMPEDDISDVLEYADIVSLNGAKTTTHTENRATFLEWDPFSLEAGATQVKTVTFKMKDVLPKTNTPPGNPQSYDCRIQNVIATSAVVIDIDRSHCITKVIERTTTTLPNTGPGTGLVISFGMLSVVGYFFARSRLMAKELDIIRHEYTTSGGA